MLDWGTNKLNNTRKMGVEITEATTNDNGISELVPTAAWGLLAGDQQAALWTHTVNLPDRTGTTITWQVAAKATLVPTYFSGTNGSKTKWMKWGKVLLTEDYGDFEWIIEHPTEVQGVTYYRDQLAEVNTARTAFRNALTTLGLGGNTFVLAMNANPVQGQVFEVCLGDTNTGSSQITIEATDPAVTKKALLEGLTTGLNRRLLPDRSSFLNADETVAATVTTVAGRFAVAGVDKELIAAYLVGDLCHKTATFIPGANWVDIAANFKQWRVLFPKSHPVQIVFQAIEGKPTPAKIDEIQVAIAAQRANILDDIVTLFARKCLARTIKVEWDDTCYTGGKDPGDVILDAVTAGTEPVGGLAALKVALVTFINANRNNFLITEFDNTLNALVDFDNPPTAIRVVRSGNFAVHTGSNRGFAFEDRAEVETTFPNLATTFDRIKAIGNRY